MTSGEDFSHPQSSPIYGNTISSTTPLSPFSPSTSLSSTDAHSSLRGAFFVAMAMSFLTTNGSSVYHRKIIMVAMEMTDLWNGQIRLDKSQKCKYLTKICSSLFLNKKILILSTNSMIKREGLATPTHKLTDPLMFPMCSNFSRISFKTRLTDTPSPYLLNN